MACPGMEVRGREARLFLGDLVDEGVHGAHGHGTRGHGARGRGPGLVALRVPAAPGRHGLPAQTLPAKGTMSPPQHCVGLACPCMLTMSLRSARMVKTTAVTAAEALAVTARAWTVDEWHPKVLGLPVGLAGAHHAGDDRPRWLRRGRRTDDRPDLGLALLAGDPILSPQQSKEL